MKRETRQRLLLGVLVVFFAFIVARQVAPIVFSGSSGQRSGATTGRGSRAGSSIDLEGLEVEELRLAALEPSNSQYRPGRDPFRFGAAPAPAAPPPPPTPTVSSEDRTRQALQAALAARERQSSAAPSRPSLPPIDMTYLGSFGPRDGRLAVFSDGIQIYNALVGEVLNEKFIVEQIGFESVDLGFVGFPDEPAQRLAAGE